MNSIKRLISEHGDEGAVTPSPSTTGVASEMTLTRFPQVFELGRQRAVESRDARIDEGELDTLRRHAEAVARKESAPAFDPVANKHDALGLGEFEEAKAKLPELERRIRLSADEVRQRRDGLATLGGPPEPPERPWGFVAACVVAVALSVAPTLRDFLFFTMDNQELAWLLAFAAGAVPGIVIAWALVLEFPRSGNPAAHWGGLIGGLGIGVAFLFVRFAGGTDGEAFYLAIGLSLLEIAATLILEGVGRGLCLNHRDYTSRTATWNVRDKYLQAAQEELAAREAEKAETMKTIDSFMQEIHSRESRRLAVEALVADAVETVVAGYYAGKATLKGKYNE